LASLSQQKSSKDLFFLLVEPIQEIWLTLLYVFLIGYLVYYFIRIRKKKYLKKIIESSLEIRHILNIDILSPLIFKKIPKRKNNFMKSMDIKDYILLDDFFIILEKHNVLLQANLAANNSKFGDSELKELNQKLLEYTNKILIEINWKQYL
jgi:hypothetical protein